jgi:hypothetical protein
MPLCGCTIFFRHYIQAHSNHSNLFSVFQYWPFKIFQNSWAMYRPITQNMFQFSLSHIQCTYEKILWWGKKISVKTVMVLHIFNYWTQRNCFCSATCFVYMHVPFASIWAGRHILFIFGIQKFMCHRSVLSEYNKHSSLKNRCPSDGFQKKLENFSKVVLMILMKFRLFIDTVTLNTSVQVSLHESNSTSTMGPNEKCQLSWKWCGWI